MKRLIRAAFRRLGKFVPASHRPRILNAIQRLRFAYWSWRVRLGWLRDKPLRHSISLIVATYNVEPFIEAFLGSVVYQSTGRKNLEIIIVDDGSTDRSGDIARRWARRFPETIRYVRKENGGVSSARNAGLDIAAGEWVSFPDPDDILSPRYLHFVDAELSRKHREPLLMVVTRLLVYRETTGRIQDNNPLTFRFRKGRHVGSSTELGDHITLGTNTAVVHRLFLGKHGLRFDGRVRPTFEDAHLINRLLLLESAKSVVFIRAANYIYRKRLQGGSLVDGAKTNVAWYLEEIEHGQLSLISLAQLTRTSVPRYIQTTLLYHIFWRFLWLVDHPERANFLTSEQQSAMHSLLKRLFEFIEPGTIQSTRLPPLHEEHRVALLGAYKGVARQPTTAYVRRIDPVRQEIQLALLTHSPGKPTLEARAGGAELPLRDYSRRHATFLGQPYFTEHRFWVPADIGPLQMTHAGAPVRFKHRGKSVGVALDGNALIDTARARGTSGAWLFMDREDKADDNAEHLYRFVRHADPSREIYFVLSQQSHDWPRLHKEGFDLVAYKSKRHQKLINRATALISSHPDDHVLYPFPGNTYDGHGTRFVFLQHGVIQNDLSLWLNGKPISTMVCTTREEHASIAAERSNYLLTARETVLTGLPRHDALLRKGRATTARHLLIMPTWRLYLTDEHNRNGIRRGKIAGFKDSTYARRWGSVLRSTRLRDVAEKAGVKIVFCAHPNMAMYLDDLDAPAWVSMVSSLAVPSLQALVAEAAMVVTDYSSIAFEAALINRPVAYYQFDSVEASSGQHTYREGYFDYERDGFGPVCQTDDAVISAFETALAGAEPIEYQRRRQDTFPFRDGRNCERVYNAVLDLLGERQMPLQTLASRPRPRSDATAEAVGL